MRSIHIFEADLEVFKQNTKTVLELRATRKGNTRYIIFLTESQVQAIIRASSSTEFIPANPIQLLPQQTNLV